MNAMGKFLGHGLLTIEGPQHRSRRKLMQPVFHSKRIQRYADVMVDYATAAVDGWRDGEMLATMRWGSRWGGTGSIDAQLPGSC